MNKFFSSLKSFLSPKDNNVTERDEADDYTIKKGKKFDITIRIFSVIAAVIIWLFAVASDSAVYTKDFSSVKISMSGYSEFVNAAHDKGFVVSYDSSMFVSFTLNGRQKFLNSIKDGDITVVADFMPYIDDIEHMDPEKENSLFLKIDIKFPKYFIISNVSAEQLEIKLIPADLTQD